MGTADAQEKELAATLLSIILVLARFRTIYPNRGGEAQAQQEVETRESCMSRGNKDQKHNCELLAMLNWYRGPETVGPKYVLWKLEDK